MLVRTLKIVPKIARNAFRSSHQDVFCKKGILRNFTIFTRKKPKALGLQLY